MEDNSSVLVIDDEQGIRVGCRRALEPHAIRVDEAQSLQEGLRKIQAGDYGLVLLDVMMPDGRGIDLLDPILAKDPHTVCVIITGYATVELAVQAIRRGAYDFISKPFTADLLLMTVRRGLEKRRLSLEAMRAEALERRAGDLARAKEEMERLDEAKTAFTLTVAHELRAPVAGGLSLLRTLRRGYAGELNEQQREILARVEGRLDLLLELVEDLLTLAASKTLAPEEPLVGLDLLPVLECVVDRLASEAEARQVDLGLESQGAGLVGRVRATRDGLERVFGNLVGNAIKYTPAGGRVRMRVSWGPDLVEVEVSDTGIGIPSEGLADLGKEFFRASNARRSGSKGTGLGLSIVWRLVDRFGGKVDVRSVEGEGSSFTVTLPLAEALPAAFRGQPMKAP